MTEQIEVDDLEKCRERIFWLWEKMQPVVQDLDRLRTLHLRLTRGRAEAARVSAAIGVSDQRRSNWMRRDLVGWIARMEERYPGADDGEGVVLKRGRVTEEDWDWIASVVVGRGKLTFGAMASVVRHHAPLVDKSHLARISPSTLWRNRGELVVRLRESPSGLPF